jgi:hypothetical protein
LSTTYPYSKNLLISRSQFYVNPREPVRVLEQAPVPVQVPVSPVAAAEEGSVTPVQLAEARAP